MRLLGAKSLRWSDVFVYFIGEAAGGCGYLLAVAVSVQRGDFLPGTSSLAEA